MRKSTHNYPFASTQRKAPSLPEGLLWRELRGKAGGLKVRRQRPAGPYVLDFYCAAAKYGFEIDGNAHDLGDRPRRDASRDEWLARQGFRTVRIAASDVLADLVAVAEGIARMCQRIIAGEV